jgi:twitching motility two-component system response regulator PilH
MAIKRILIVDDSPTERHYLSEILARGGFDVVTSDSGEDALQKARALLPDLILMDVVMPGMNGFQATRANTRDAATKNIPVLICTTKSQETDRIWGLRQGARDYMVKPVQGDVLLKKIETMSH